MNLRIAIISLLLVSLAVPARALQTETNHALFTFLKPKPGKKSEFVGGYKTHLKWHLEAGDSWNWLGWFITSGPRTGLFVDATIERSRTELNNPVDPTGDRADLAKNVIPYVDLDSRFRCVLLREFSELGLDDHTARYQMVFYFSLIPDREADFRKFMTLTKVYLKNRGQRFGWYRIEGDASIADYFLILPQDSFSGLRSSASILEEVMDDEPDAFTFFKSTVESVRSEAMTYREDLSVIPESGVSKRL